MASQCMAHVYWWQASIRRHHLPAFRPSSSQFTVPPFFSRSVWEEMLAFPSGDYQQAENSGKQIICFRDGDSSSPFTEFVDKDLKDIGVKTNLQIRYSPWAVDMVNGFGGLETRKLKESAGGPVGGGRGGDDNGDDGDGGDEDDEGGEYVFLLPVLTLAFAAFHLGYCIAVWVKDENLDLGFFRTGLGLFGLLALSAIRLNSGAGLDAYILGLGASLGVMAWTGERCLVKKEGSPAGVVALFAAIMALMFTAALYHNI